MGVPLRNTEWRETKNRLFLFVIIHFLCVVVVDVVRIITQQKTQYY